jgi:hypothetical protein
MNVKVRNRILKSKTLNFISGKGQKDVLVTPSQVLSLIQDLTISASHLCFGFDLTFEL